MFAFGSMAVASRFDGIRRFRVSVPQVRYVSSRSRCSAPPPGFLISPPGFSAGQSGNSISPAGLCQIQARFSNPPARFCRVSSGFFLPQSSACALPPGALSRRQGDFLCRQGFFTGSQGSGGQKTSPEGFRRPTAPCITPPKSLICPFSSHFQPPAPLVRGSGRFRSHFPADGLPGKTKQNNKKQQNHGKPAILPQT